MRLHRCAWQAAPDCFAHLPSADGTHIIGSTVARPHRRLGRHPPRPQTFRRREAGHGLRGTRAMADDQYSRDLQVRQQLCTPARSAGAQGSQHASLVINVLIARWRGLRRPHCSALTKKQMPCVAAQAAVEAARLAGAEIKAAFDAPKSVSHKGKV